MAAYMKKVLFVDEQELFCEGFLTVFKFQKNFEVIDIASNWLETLTKTEDLMPDVVIMDLYIPHVNWVQTIRSIKEKFPYIILIVLTIHKSYMREVIQAGANAYITKDIPVVDILAIIETVSKKSHLTYPFHFDHISSTSDQDDAENYLLTKREIEVLTLVSKGFQNKEIATDLSIEIPTVNNHLYNIYKKLKCSNRTEAVFTAVNRGIIHINS